MGVVGAHGRYGRYVCLGRISSLQQAELYAAYAANKLAVGNRLHCVAKGGDNDASHTQASLMWTALDTTMQHHILRRIFWLRV